MSKADRLQAVEDTLAALTEAVNANAGEHARRQGEILTAIRSAGDRMAELAEAVRVVMAARTGQESGGEGRRT